METIKVILVDDHTVVRNGIKALINGMEGIEVIDEAGNDKELQTSLKLKTPDILILDISLPGKSGIDLSREINEKYPEIKILILSMYTNEEFIFNAIKAGARGYLPKNTSKMELNNAINEIQKGNEYFSEPISNIILKSYIKKAKDEESQEKETGLQSLSEREKQVLQMFAEGKSNKEISDGLCISVRTVESHKHHIMHKLNLKSIVDLIKFAIKNKIIHI